jgi:hypothetical protein
MLSDKVKSYCKGKGWWYEDESQEYIAELFKLGVPKNSDFGEFYLHVEDGPTFISRGKEIYQVCWFSKNTNFDLALRRTRETLGLGVEYIPLDSFEAESGYFYNVFTEEVYELSLGDNLEGFASGGVARWSSYNSFIEFYFGLL